MFVLALSGPWRLATAATVPAEGLELWLRAGEGVVQSDGTVSRWQDQSGNGNHLLAAGTPKLIPALTPTGEAAIRLDGAGDKLERIHATDPITGLPGGNADRTMFAVVKFNSSSAWAGAAYGNGASNEVFGLSVQHPAGELVLQGWGGANDLVSTTRGTGAGWLVQSAVLNNGTATLYKDGEQIAQAAHAFNTNPLKLVIGEEIANLGFVEMDVAAVLIYGRALRDAERNRLEEYLTTKYTADSEPPTTPTGVTATGVYAGQIDVRWPASTDNVAVMHYRVFRDGIEVGTSTEALFSDTKLEPPQKYSYTVIAVDGSGNESDSSAPVDAVLRSVTLEWDAIPGADIAGYRIHFGTASGVYSYSVYVGNATTATLSHLTAQTVYYCAVTAYSNDAAESSFSDEIVIPARKD